MANSIQLSIPERCHENWSAMSTSEKGRFCQACNKQVIDFSKMNDSEIVRFFNQPAGATVCGRFSPGQLDRDLFETPKRKPFYRHIIQLIFPAFLVSLKAKAQGGVIKFTSDQVKIAQACKVDSAVIKTTDTSHIQHKPFRGQVVDMDGNPVNGAPIVLMGTKFGMLTDSNGYFEFRIKHKQATYEFIISTVGFEGMRKVVSYEELQQERFYVLQLLSDNKGRVVITKPGRRTIKLIPGIIKDTISKLFKAYPNPVRSGTTLNLEWNQAETGDYFLQLISSEGRLIHSRKLWIDAEARVLSLEVPSVVAGSYYLRMTNTATGKNFTEKVMIQ